MLRDVLINNAVRCVPPGNKPTAEEIKTCRSFLSAQIGALPSLKIILALGGIAHRSVVASFGARQVAFQFGHCRAHQIRNGLTLMDSYHCSRYNTNTGRLTTEMFEAVFAEIRRMLGNA